MSYMKISVRDNFSEALMQKLDRAGPRAAHTLAVQVAKDTEPFVPALTKSLANRTQVVENKIIYPGPYARVLYHGKVMVDPITHAAGFLTEDGWKSRKGVKKIQSDRDLDIKTSVHKQAQAHWFEGSKTQNLEKWVRVGERAVKNALKE